jgi:hypothetical protein
MKSAIKAPLRKARDYVRYKADEFTGKWGEKFEGHYTAWRARRIQTILDEYGNRFFEAKTILEVGAGYGAIGAFFGILGADVTCLEGRAGNVQVIKGRYPFIKAMLQDLNQGIPGNEKYAVMIHLGVLYHLADPEKSLREACRRCDHLILETEVSDSDDPHFMSNVKEHAYIYDQALDGVGSRPSQAYVERVMTEEGFTFKRLNDGRCNWELHVYDWPLKNTKTHRNGLRRMWFAKKSTGIE